MPLRASDIHARRLDYFQALEAEHPHLALAEDAIVGLKDALSGQFVSSEDLIEALGIKPSR